MDKALTFTTPGGEEMVILPADEYRRLVARRDVEDDLGAARKTLERVKAGLESTLPIEVVRMVRVDGVSRLRAWRTHRGLSPAALARKIGKSASYLTQLENGTREGTLATMSKLARALDTTLDCLVD